MLGPSASKDLKETRLERCDLDKFCDFLKFSKLLIVDLYYKLQFHISSIQF